ncbi:GFA family protein [Pseudomonas sp. 5P_3.1_Bac2]|uniref:GFA family protein n=1 Tax=Pseudomonas sp. 5P_3.1_Bac2 TaxID=2971617 RepID=UPI0021CA7FD4|nr:GFA family protein [Pseudomonas sp. 5P_3.1_Bac2]MCU1716277.1 GFA family protein [Pseudomonas sp. 5P_3.1_Bac2]
MHSGSCLCQAVCYQIATPIAAGIHCHCQQCRKAHGAAFASYVNVRREHFVWSQGEQWLRRYQSSPGVTRTFCGQCGSTLLWLGEQRPNWLSVALATLDTPLDTMTWQHIHLDSKAPWHHWTDGLSATNAG